MKLTRFATLASIAVLVGSFAAGPATAQKASTAKSSTTKTSTKKAAPKKKTASPKTAAKKSTKKKSAAKKPTSPCVGLKQRACTANKVCGWIKPKKKVSTDGRKLTAYCRKVAGIGKKKQAAKKSTAKKTATKKTAAKKPTKTN